MKSLEELVEDFIDHSCGLRNSPHTVARQRSALKKFIEYLDEQHRILTPDQLMLEHIHSFQSHLSTRLTKSGMPLKPSTVNTIIKAVRPYLALLYDYGYLRRPLDKHLKYVREPKLLPKSVLTHAQVRKLVQKIDTNTSAGIRDRAMIELMYSSGIRIGEVLRLVPGDIDLERGIARVFGKGSKERFVPVGKTAVKWLTSYIRGVRPFMLKGKNTEAVFLNSQGGPLSQRRINDLVRMYGRKLGLDIQVTPHTFRRSCTSEMIKGNANLYHVKQLLGHEQLDTLNRYAKLNIEDLRKTHSKCHPREREE